MSTTAQRTQRVRHPFAFRLVEVVRTERLTPHMMRVTVGGEDLKGFQSAGADDHMKVFFPDEGQEKPVLPQVTPEGVVWPQDAKRPASRDFTPRRYDAEANELDIDFVLHGAGPAASWAAQAQPGQFIGIGGPRGSHVVTLDFDWYLLIGDETALPFISRQVEELPAGARAIAIVEVSEAADEQAIASEAGVDWHWVHRNGAEAGTTDLLVQAVRGIKLLPGEFFTWAAGEANTLRDIRRHLLNERGVNRDWARFNGHWKYNVTNWDHHEPIED